MQTFQEVLESYGTDYINTMERVMQDENLYLRLLTMLLDEKSVGELKVALEKGDLPNAFEAAHTLKGVAANMGLMPLLEAVCLMVEPLRAGEERSDYFELYQKVEEEFLKVGEMQTRLREIM